MSTKVKGDKIKEGSIPLSALNDEVKDKIENARGGADWNAAEGEPGYIENRTHYTEITLLAEQCSVGNTTTDIENLPITFRFDDYYLEHLESYPFVDLRIVDNVNDEIFDFRINIENTGSQDFDFGFIYVHEYDGSGVPIAIALLMCNPVDLYGVKYNTINVNYLPETVVKTTPQELKNEDRNQALANLGIDPVVWKYICNPLVIENGKPVPEELIGEYVYHGDDMPTPSFEKGYKLKYPNLGMYKVLVKVGDTSIVSSFEGYSDKGYLYYNGLNCFFINSNKKWKYDR